MEAVDLEAHGRGGKPTRFALDIEGTVYDWDRPTITVPEIREIGGLPAGVAVLEINLKTNEELTLPEDEVVDLKPGLGFSKKVEFRRG